MNCAYTQFRTDEGARVDQANARSVPRCNLMRLRHGLLSRKEAAIENVTQELSRAQEEIDLCRKCVEKTMAQLQAVGVRISDALAVDEKQLCDK
eukprot:1929497-Pleurochrysis_carterae.AAC.1